MKEKNAKMADAQKLAASNRNPSDANDINRSVNLFLNEKLYAKYVIAEN